MSRSNTDVCENVKNLEDIMLSETEHHILYDSIEMKCPEQTNLYGQEIRVVVTRAREGRSSE